MSLNPLTAYNTVEASATVNQLALKVKSYVNQLTQKTDEQHKTGLSVDVRRRKFLQRGGNWPRQMAWIRRLKSFFRSSGANFNN